MLSTLVLDLPAGAPRRGDIEVRNEGPGEAYVVVEPSEIADPGTPAERRTTIRDPQALGLLATPDRLVLEPGQRKLVRIAALAPPGDRERIYRVTVKPVTGAVSGPVTGLKLLVGYDVLVILRPVAPRIDISAARSGRSITFTNRGNTNVEMYDGRQCDAGGRNCTNLPARRVYAGATFRVTLPGGGPVGYSLRAGDRVERKTF